MASGDWPVFPGAFYGHTLEDIFAVLVLQRSTIIPTEPTHQVGPPVGGFMIPVNKLTVFAPYLALFGIVAAVAVVVWKKREN